MNRGALALGVLAVAVAPAAAAPVDKAQVRQALGLPTIFFHSGISFDSRTGLSLVGERDDCAREVEALRAALCGSDHDAERYHRLGLLYARAGDARRARAAQRKAARLFAARLKARPDDGVLTARLGAALGEIERGPRPERLLRRAVRLAPDEPECWRALGVYLHARALGDLLGRAGGDLPDLLGWRVKEGAITRAEAEQATRTMAEALECLDRAIALCPKLAAPYHERRAHVRLSQHFLRPALQAALGQPPSPPNWPSEPLEDLRRAAELAPSPASVGLAAAYAIVSACLPNEALPFPNGPGLRRRLPESSRRFVDEALGKLEAFGRAEDAATAARALELLGTFHVVYHGDAEEAEACLRQAVALAPDREGAWDLLSGLLAAEPNQMLGVCRARLAGLPTARSHYLMAKALEWGNDLRRAEAHVEAALMLEPDHFLANLGLAALLMKRGGPAEMARADRLLDAAEKALGADPLPAERRVADALRASWLLLEGRDLEAGPLLTRLARLSADGAGQSPLLQGHRRPGH